MKKLVFVSMMCLLALAAQAQGGGITGDWSGKLNVFGNEITLVFHLDDENCTLDSPDQGAKGIAATLERTDMGMKVTVPSINARASVSYEAYLAKAYDTNRNDYRSKLIHNLGDNIGVCFQIIGW